MLSGVLCVHRTPKHGSWLNQAEIEVALVSRLVVGRRRIGDRSLLRTEVTAFNVNANRNRTVIHWGFTRMDARREFGYKCTFKRPRD